MAGELISLVGEDFTEATTIAQILLLASLFMAGRTRPHGRGQRPAIRATERSPKSHRGSCSSPAWRFSFLVRSRGVALALAVSWGASLLLLVTFARRGRPTGARRAKLAEASRRLVAFPRLEAQHVFVLTAAALLSVLGGLAAVFFPKVALGLVIALAAGLFFAFARRVLPDPTRSFQRRVAIVATRCYEVIRSPITRLTKDSTFRAASTTAASCCSALSPSGRRARSLSRIFFFLASASGLCRARSSASESARVAFPS